MMQFLKTIQNKLIRSERQRKKSEEETAIMYLIAGLGNPTRQYEKTRHNIGFDTIDKIAEKYGIPLRDAKLKSACGSGVIAGQKVLLMKPQTFMNNSGEAIRAALDFYKLNPETQLLVIYDDISLEPGNLRIRLKGSAGGHNGIKSIIAHAGTQTFARMKIGVGRKPDGWDLADYVLGRFAKEEREAVEAAMADAVAAAELIISGDAAQAMNLYNKKKI